MFEYIDILLTLAITKTNHKNIKNHKKTSY